MMLNKKVLLLGLVAAMVAVAIPSMVGAAEWYDEETEELLGEEEGAPSGAYLADGTLSITLGGLVSGPCPVTIEGYLWNQSPNGTGSVLNFEAGGNCPTNFTETGCEVESITPAGIPWKVTVVALNDVHFDGVTFQAHYSAGCMALIGTTTAAVSGTLKSLFNNGTGCFEPSKAGELKQEGTETPATVTGKVCFTPKKILQ